MSILWSYNTTFQNLVNARNGADQRSQALTWFFSSLAKLLKLFTGSIGIQYRTEYSDSTSLHALHKEDVSMACCNDSA